MDEERQKTSTFFISSLLPPKGIGIAIHTRAPFSYIPVIYQFTHFVVNIFISQVVSFNNRLQSAKVTNLSEKTA
jgi:hypothetical protein